VRRRGPLAAFFAFGFFWGAWAALVPAIQDAVGASKGQLGLALLFVAIGSLPSMLVTGRELDRHGARLIPVLLAGLGVAALLPAFANGIPALAASLFVIGVLGGALDVAINAAVSELEVRRGTRLMQLAHALFSAGLLVGAIASGLSRQLGATRFEVLGGVAVMLFAAGALNLGHERVQRRPAAKPSLRLSRAAIPLGIACAGAFVIEGGMENWGALFLERELDSNPAVSALAPAAYAGAMMLGRLSGQWLEQLLGDALLLMGAFGVALLGLITVALAQNVPVVVIAFFVGGAGISIAAPALFGAGGRNAAPEERGRAVATVTTIGYVGFLVGPPLVGGAAEAVGLRAAFAALALVAIALVVATPRLGLSRKSA
jgi:MFS family permease